MIPIKIKVSNYLFSFSVAHITNESSTKLIYGINLNYCTYYLSKTIGINSCKQLDNHAPLDPMLLDELCTIITEIELSHIKRPALELINQEILAIIRRIKSPIFEVLKTSA